MDEHAGTGPGAITSDGCAVEFYALLPAFGEPEIIHAAVPPRASILELGCGTGRMRVEVEYQAGGSVWTHAWTSYQISDEELAGNLADASLRLGDWLTDDRSWFTARPAPAVDYPVRYI